MTVWQEAETKTATTAVSSRPFIDNAGAAYSRQFFALILSVYARLVSVLPLLFAAPPIKVTTGQ